MPARRRSSVTDHLFREHPAFFRTRDLLQLKYEMLRAQAVDTRPVRAVCQAFGFSRQSFYTLRARFRADGLNGLMPRAPGRLGPTKCTPEVMAFLREAKANAPTLFRRGTCGARRRTLQHTAPSADRGALTRAASTARKKSLKVSCVPESRSFLGNWLVLPRPAMSGFGPPSSPAHGRPRLTAPGSHAAVSSVSWRSSTLPGPWNSVRRCRHHGRAHTTPTTQPCATSCGGSSARARARPSRRW